ncbi:hypothetical protein [Halostella salina]|uniref:hypothetical protein n=1 Tax=Halostella salina TaxID=1547897 RepID=UPI000EF775D8|nr:hypothetical protein [Halostella salina]
MNGTTGDGPDADVRRFGPAYTAALAGCLVSSVLTFAYVGGPARELNPVLRAVIDVIGLELMVPLRVAVAAVGYWAYFVVAQVSDTGRAAVALGWLTALVYVGDGLHDLRVAAAAGPPDPGVAAVGGLLLVVAAALGVALRPPTVVRGSA